MTTLEDFYYGNIIPYDKDIKKDSKYKKHAKVLLESIDAFDEKLSGENRNCFQQIIEDIYRLNADNEKDSFTKGFCLGAQMMLEVMSFK